MNLWQNFEIDQTKLINNGISFRYEKGIDEELKRKFIQFDKWLRRAYVFPVHINVSCKNCEKVKLMSGAMAYGSFRWFEDRAPYIRIPAKIDSQLYETFSREELYEQVLSSLVHELSHYYQWFLGLEQDNATSERQANYFRYRIIDKYYTLVS